MSVCPFIYLFVSESCIFYLSSSEDWKLSRESTESRLEGGQSFCWFKNFEFAGNAMLYFCIFVVFKTCYCYTLMELDL